MFKLLRFFILFFIIKFIITPFSVFAQKNDSISSYNDSIKVFGFYENALDSRNFENKYFDIDTSISNFHKKEYFYHDEIFYAQCSNPGLAERKLFFQNDYDLNQFSSNKYFESYLKNNSKAVYYSNQKPFSNAFYMTGANKKQLLDVLFTRNFGKLWNISVDYSIIYSKGKYNYQESNDNFVLLTSNYHSKKNKYFFIADYFYNRMNFQENGGILNDSGFALNNIQSSGVKVNLQNSNAKNKIKESGFYFRQYYFPGFTLNKKDTLKDNDKYLAFGRLSHSILFKNQSETYTDANPMSGFYQNVYLDTASTHDSIFVNTLENKVEWSNMRYGLTEKEQNFIFTIGIKDHVQQLYTYNTDTSFTSLIPEMSCNIFFNPVNINVKGFCFLNGYNKSDYSASATIDYHFSKNNIKEKVLSLLLSTFSQTPYYFDQYFYSNNFKWNNNFTQMHTARAGVLLKYKNIFSQISLYSLTKPVYYDNYAKPKQKNGSTQLLQVQVKKDFKWKNICFDNNIVYQKVLGNDIIRLPEFTGNHSLYYSNKFLKIFSSQIGADLTFYSSYSPLAYMPATRQFYIQNDYQSSLYPYIDFFINLKIKRIRFFLKMDHVNSGLMGYDYFTIPNYPMAGRSFRVGLSWVFYD